ncbi:MAG TPA: hypothetical protein VGC01_13665 [Mucilaginibacter sp.]
MSTRFCFFMLFGCVLIASCGHQEKAPINHAEDKKPVLMAPFKFHKLIESSPGKYYDILSWGRGGATDTSSFLILHTDSSGKKYTTTTGDLEGAINDVYNTDMDVDGNPEILIQAKKKDTIDHTTIYAFEFSDNKAQKLDFPKLSSSQRKGYRGGDNFYIEEGKFIREFPVYDGSGKEAKPTGQKRKLEYGLRSNEFTVTQLSKDSTQAKAVKTTEPKVVQKTEPEKKKKDKSEKHHKTEQQKKSHKKRHHHHNNDDDSDA